MNRDDIIRMAQEAGSNRVLDVMVFGSDEYLERFAAIVAAAEREAMLRDGWRQCAVGQRTTQFCGMTEDAVKAEREACAQECEKIERRKWETVMNGGAMQGIGARDCAAAIRARGEK